MTKPLSLTAAPAPYGRYLRPEKLADALAALAASGYAVLAGGTDFYPARVGRWIDEDILDITAIAELRGIHRDADRIRLGALVTWADVLAADLPSWCAGLVLAAREIGGVQIQNAGTLVGNLCNASPAADGVPALLALDARVELASHQNRRLVHLDEFIVGSRKTVRAGDELVTAIHLPRPSARACSTFVKLGARKYLVISIVMVAANLDLDTAGNITYAAVAVGSCSAVAQRLPQLEARLLGARLSPHIGELLRPGDLAPIAPIDDVRASAAYRREAAQVLIGRALAGLAA